MNNTVPECRTAVHRNVLVSLLETIVLAHVVQVVTSDDDGASHFVFDDNARQDSTANRYVAGEWTLLVDVRAFDRLKRQLEL